MTILLRLEKRDMELTVCGMISKEWLDGLVREEKGIAQAQGGLTEGQWAWREIHRQALEAESGAVAPQPPQAPRLRRRRPAARSTPKDFDLIDTAEL